MAVVPRKRAGGRVVYYVVFTWQGKPVWEKSGTDRRAADSLDSQRKREVREGNYQPGGAGRATTVLQWGSSWLATRNVRSVRDEERWLRRHVFPRAWLSNMALRDVQPRDIDQLVRELQALRKGDERALSDKSISNVVGVLSVMFKAAKRAGLAGDSPVELERNALARAPQRERETYTPTEVRILTRHASILWPVRVLNALVLLGGLREGEACGRRWKDLDTAARPLWGLHVHDQYGGRPLKTNRPRWVPVHPELAAVLEAWGREGFELLTRRKPTPDDFIVPLVGPRAKTPHHTRSTFYKAFIRACLAADVPPRTLHSTRHTFATLARRGGAPKDRVERITHNARGDIVDRYTHFDWQPLCDAVLCIDLDLHQEPQPPRRLSGKTGASPEWLGRRNPSIQLNTAATQPGSIPGASTPNQQETSGSSEARQDPRQEHLAAYGSSSRPSDRGPVIVDALGGSTRLIGPGSRFGGHKGVTPLAPQPSEDGGGNAGLPTIRNARDRQSTPDSGYSGAGPRIGPEADPDEDAFASAVAEHRARADAAAVRGRR